MTNSNYNLNATPSYQIPYGSIYSSLYIAGAKMPYIIHRPTTYKALPNSLGAKGDYKVPQNFTPPAPYLKL